MEKSSSKQYVGRIWKSAQEIPVYIANGRLIDDKNEDETKLVQFILGNPWAGNAFSTKLKRLDNGDYRFRYKAIHLDTLDCVLYGYGKSPDEAEQNCYNVIKQVEAM